MKTTLSRVNYLNLLVKLSASTIKEVRLVKNTYLVRFTRHGNNFALFVKTSEVLAPFDLTLVHKFERAINKKLSKDIRIEYSAYTQRFTLIINRIPYKTLSIEKFAEENRLLLIEEAEAELENQRNPKPRLGYSDLAKSLFFEPKSPMLKLANRTTKKYFGCD